MARKTTPRAEAIDDAAIVDAALALAEERGWHAVRMVDIADRLHIPPQQLLAQFRDLDAVADAWFRRALEAMIAPKDEGFADLPAKQRLEVCLLAWFDALAPHHRVTVEMLRGKMHVWHPHHWVPMIFSLSRTVQWLREAALMPAVYGTQRARAEEIVLTGLFLATLRVWAGDRTPDQERTRRYLRRRLDRLDALATSVWRENRTRNAPPEA